MQKILVLYNRQGEIISAAHLERAAEEVKGTPSREFGVVAGRGQKVAELEVPAAHEKLALHELIEKLQVDVKTQKLRLRRSKA